MIMLTRSLEIYTERNFGTGNDSGKLIFDDSRKFDKK